MASFKSNPVFFGTIGLLVAVAALEGYFIYAGQSSVAKASKQVMEKEKAYKRYNQVTPFPSEANKDAIIKELVDVNSALDQMKTALKGKGPKAAAIDAATVPASRTDAYFDLANYVQRMSRRAEEAGVMVKPGSNYGFSLYASSGPDEGLIKDVFRQRQISEYLLNALFDAHPVELVSLQRERVFSAAQKKQIEESRQNGMGMPSFAAPGVDNNQPDFFMIDRRISARVPGFIDTSAFSLSFVGTTQSLRELLNKLAEFELPIVVRSVEVEPATPTGPAPKPAATSNDLSSIFGPAAGSAAQTPPPPTPLVPKSLSKFKVVIEYIDLVAANDTQTSS